MNGVDIWCIPYDLLDLMNDLDRDEVVFLLGDMDYYKVREFFYNHGYVLLYDVDDRLYFVKERVVKEIIEGINRDEMTLCSHNCYAYDSMNYDLMVGLEQLLRDPLGFDLAYYDYRRPKKAFM